MSTKISKKELGRYGEKIAAWYYQKLGYQIIGQNLWTRAGEIDLLLKQNNKFLIIEVKTRQSFKFGLAEESVSANKIQHLIDAYYSLQPKLNLPTEFDLEICVLEIMGQKIKIFRWLI